MWYFIKNGDTVLIYCGMNLCGLFLKLVRELYTEPFATFITTWRHQVWVRRYKWFTSWYADFLQNPEDSTSCNPVGLSRPVKWKVYLIGGYRTFVFHPAVTQALLTEQHPFGLCVKSSAASTMFTNSLVLYLAASVGCVQLSTCSVPHVFMIHIWCLWKHKDDLLYLTLVCTYI